MAEERGGDPKKHDKNHSYSEGEILENGAEEEEPDFTDPEGFVDDITDEELLGDLLKRKPKETDGIDSVVVVDNVPEVGPERLPKLQNVVRKIFNQFGNIIHEHYPMENEKSKGYIFLEYATPQQAQEAVKAANGYKLDKTHTFAVNLFSDFDKYANVPDEWEPPEMQPYQDHGNMCSWLLNEECHDQFSVIYEGGDRTAMMLNTGAEPTVIEERARWTETYIRWSPRGTYLATFHQKGIALWGAEKFKQIMRFSHTGVQLIDFSPCERYMVTFSPMPDNRDDPQAVIIWDLRTGQKKRGFHCDNASSWPIFKWGHDGQYFARMIPDAISIYETPSFGLLAKSSIKILELRDFQWSPTDNIIAYWTPEDQNVPARVTVMEVPSRKELSVKTLFSVKECHIHWQKCGNYLCIKVDRYVKKKEENDQIKYAGIYHNLNVFHMREKQIPVDIVEVKDTIIAFAWEPVGTKFAIIQGENPRICVTLYQVTKGGKNVEILTTFEKRQANTLFWCPNGQFLAVAGLRSMNGVLEFIDTGDMTVMAQGEHFMATDVEWDPTGRYVVTAVSWWGHKVDNAYWIWNFQGRLLMKQPMEKFCQLQWRPRPAPLLSVSQMKDVKKNLNTKYRHSFELKDRQSQSKASKDLIEKRQHLMEEYEQWRDELQNRFDSEKDMRLDLRRGIDTDELDSYVENMEEEVIEFLVKVEETPLE